MSKTIIFIHGMFQNDKSWANWIKFFENKGYTCIAKPWPFHNGEPDNLRNNIPAGLGKLRLKTVVDEFEDIIKNTDDDPILIGHSVGGLIVQILMNKGYGSAGVCIDSVAPNKMLAFDWSFFRNSVQIANPFAGDEPFKMTAEGFHKNFANTLSKEESDIAYEKTATHDSRNMLRDCLMEDGHIDTDLPHEPLLFIGGEMDEIIPPELNEKNAKAYIDRDSISTFKKFPGRGHFICGQPGWQEVANYIEDWLEIYAVDSPVYNTMKQV